jgi:hypothetical protein
LSITSGNRCAGDRGCGAQCVDGGTGAESLLERADRRPLPQLLDLAKLSTKRAGAVASKSSTFSGLTATSTRSPSGSGRTTSSILARSTVMRSDSPLCASLGGG